MFHVQHEAPKLTRRGLLGALGAVLCAPAIVRVSSIMPVSVATIKPLPIDAATLYRRELMEQYRLQIAKWTLVDHNRNVVDGGDWSGLVSGEPAEWVAPARGL